MEFRIWQNKLYNLQLEAPKPHLIACHNELVTRPPQYGLEFHGPISRQETEDLLQHAPDGAYLIRQSQRAVDAYTLVIWFDGVARNYKLFYDAETKQHYVGENRFDTVDLLVADGLIHFYVETRGADVLLKMAEANNYERTPFYKMRYHTFSASALQSGLQKCLKDSIDSPIEQKKTEVDAVNRVRKSRRTYVPTVGESNSALNLADFNVSKVQWRRQSADGEPFSRPNTTTVLPPPQSLTDWPLSPDKFSHSKSDGRNYRDCPPLAELCEFRRSSVLQPEALPEPHSDFTIPPVPPPRISSGVNQLLRPSLSEASESTASAPVHPADPPSTAFRKNSQFSSGHLVDGAFVKLENIPENADSPHTTQISQEFDSAVCSTLETSASSGDHSSLSGTSGSPTNASPLFVSRRQSHPTRQDRNRHAVLLADSTETGSPSSVTVNGENRQAMLSLLERYKLPAACLVGDHSGTPVNADRRKHNFKVQTFRGPHWCDFCTHFIWGLVAQGVKCTECGFQAHKRCSDRVPDDCLPDIKQMKRVFGVDLISLAIAERKPVPTILERCIGEVEKRGALVCEGLYRVPGNHDRVEQARAAFDKDFESAAISPSRIPDVNVITSLIKCFLRQLPVPLITYDAHPKLIDIICNDQLTEEEKLCAITAVLSTLPPAHYESLRFFMRHIHRVAANHERNMMSVENLAVVLTPSLMSSSYTDPMSCMVGMQKEHALVERLIRDYARLFPIADRPLRRNFTMEPDHPHEHGSRALPSADRPNTQWIPDGLSFTPARPTPAASSHNRRWFTRNRRSMDTQLLTSPPAGATQTPPPTPVPSVDAAI